MGFTIDSMKEILYSVRLYIYGFALNIWTSGVAITKFSGIKQPQGTTAAQGMQISSGKKIVRD